MSEHQTEIVIIKRKGGHGDEHHGGAWKIAFADFMTAMMAFFLVLWIINATDKDTKTIIARYFNPVKLENPARARKGVHGVDASRVVSDNSTGEPTEGTETGTPNNQGREGKNVASRTPTPPGAPTKKDENPTPPPPMPTLQRTMRLKSNRRCRRRRCSAIPTKPGQDRRRPRSHESVGLA